MVTVEGNKIAWKLAKSIGWTHEIAEICSLLHRHAVTYHAIQESFCNGHPIMDDPNVPVEKANRVNEKYLDNLRRKEEQIEKRCIFLVSQLPHTDAGPIGLEFSGDPRGCCMTLIMPDGNTDNWANTGICL